MGLPIFDDRKRFRSTLCDSSRILKYRQECPRLAPVMDLPLLDGQITHTLQGLRDLLAKIRESSLSAQRGETSIAYLIPLCEAMRKVLSADQRTPALGELALRLLSGFEQRIRKHYQVYGLQGGVCGRCISFKVPFRALCS